MLLELELVFVDVSNRCTDTGRRSKLQHTQKLLILEFYAYKQTTNLHCLLAELSQLLE